MSNYSFNKLCSPSKLKKEIEESLITIALDYITTSESPVNTTVYFKAELSTDEENTLNDIIQNHIITPLDLAAQIPVKRSAKIKNPTVIITILIGAKAANEAINNLLVQLPISYLKFI